MKSFTGIWATFSTLDHLLASIDALKEKDLEPETVHAPFNISEKLNSDHSKGLGLGHFTLTGAILGAFGSFYLILIMSVEWIQPLSAKPIFSLLTTIPIAFELTILFAVIFLLVGILVLGIKANWRMPLPASEAYKTYKRFSRDRFGLVLACNEAEISALKSLLQNHHAEEVFIEK